MAFPASEECIQIAETALGRRLPQELRERLRINNGGDVSTTEGDWILNPVRDASDRKRSARTANDMVKETQEARGWRSFPTGGIAVASNGAGDLLILQAGSENMFLWNHETGTTSPVSVDWS
ncbi:SMI1/KNR4 family protein [Peteryoungia aggregata]|uniref:SMI1/KNR4 family protein n=1 Tax=Peteryoungia aggregata TaxID=34013 RepID=UPI003521DF81